MYAGIDLGSRTIGVVVLKDGEIDFAKIEDSGYDPLTKVKKILPEGCSRITATGYGRHVAGADFACRVITEIKAHALGAYYLFPGARTVLDIGGQDTKVIRLNDRGTVVDFQMNDKCSAGTGKFLEVMARALEYPHINDFSMDALQGNEGIKISQMCTVFAESEAVSLVYKGAARGDIARALHSSVVERTIGMLKRIDYRTPLVFTGGVAYNACIAQMLKEKLGEEIYLPQNPQLVGALGAALSY